MRNLSCWKIRYFEGLADLPDLLTGITIVMEGRQKIVSIIAQAHSTKRRLCFVLLGHPSSVFCNFKSLTFLHIKIKWIFDKDEYNVEENVDVMQPRNEEHKFSSQKIYYNCRSQRSDKYFGIRFEKKINYFLALSLSIVAAWKLHFDCFIWGEIFCSTSSKLRWDLKSALEVSQCLFGTDSVLVIRSW